VDPLTGVPNRSIFLDRLGQTVSKAKRYKESFAVLFIDLDNFKTINDNYGHRIGDEVLTRAAGLIQSQVRESDTLARFGGDEFCVILNNLGRMEAACTVAEGIIDKVRAPMDIAGIQAQVGASIGIALCPSGSCATPEELLLQADAAMYQAKRSGGGRYLIHDCGKTRTG
jgi:diguanylate cyclase (GGDEF)-like protein